jgi:hypothetical protein
MIPEYMVKVGAAGVAGSLQPFILKKFILTDTTPHIEGLPGTMGSSAFLVNTALSLGAIGLAAYGAVARKGPLVDREHQDMALAYGIPAFIVGVALHYQGQYQLTAPHQMTLRAVQVAPGGVRKMNVPALDREYNPVF